MLAALDWSLLDRLPFSGLGATMFHTGLVVVGLLLWLAGRRLVKPVLAVAGLVIGGAGGYLTAPLAGAQGLGWLLVILGAVCGCLLAVMLFRIWMALSTAMVLCAAVPAAVLIWQGTPTPPMPEDLEALSPPADAAELTPENLAGRWKRLQEAYVAERESVGQWWRGLEPGLRRVLQGAAALGAVAGFIVGFIGPKTAASCQTALAGAILAVVGLRALSVLHAPDLLNRWHVGPRAWLVLVGLITPLGVLVQWSIWRRKTDKS